MIHFRKAVEDKVISETISKVLYPADNNPEGRELRLKQQYFICCASINDIVNLHMAKYGTLDNLAEQVAK